MAVRKREAGRVIRTIAFVPDQLVRLAALAARLGRRQARSSLVREGVELLLASYERRPEANGMEQAAD